mgnify:CR=1 FL=1
MTYTQAQIDKANAVDLEKFLRAQGETLVRSGKECRWKAHDSLTVCGNKWFRHSQSKGGLPVDFVMEFYGKSFPEAVQVLTGEPGKVQPEADPAPSPAFRLPLRTSPMQHPELSDAGAETQSITGELLHRRRGYLRGFRPPQRGLCGTGCRRASPLRKQSWDSGEVSAGCSRRRKGVWLCPPWHRQAVAGL